MHYYALERLWKSATRLQPAELSAPPRRARTRNRSSRPRRRTRS